MQVFIRTLALTFALGILAIALGLFSTHPAGAAGSAPVMVTNTPLPVQGTVTVGNTPSVNVANAAVPVQGNVNIGTMPSVNIGNVPAVLAQQSGVWNLSLSGNSAASPLFIRDVENPAHSRLRIERTMHLNSASSFATDEFLTDLPRGSRYVIEFIGADCVPFVPNPTSAQVASLNVFVADDSGGGAFAGHEYPLTLAKGPVDFFGQTHYTSSQTVKLYADGVSPQASLATNVVLTDVPSPSGFSCTFAFSGYTVNVP